MRRELKSTAVMLLDCLENKILLETWTTKQQLKVTCPLAVYVLLPKRTPHRFCALLYQAGGNRSHSTRRQERTLEKYLTEKYGDGRTGTDGWTDSKPHRLQYTTDETQAKRTAHK